MVSIPDWSRFRRLGQPSGDRRHLSADAKYYKQQAYDVIRQAEKHGYFVSPTTAFLEQCLRQPAADGRTRGGRFALTDVLVLRLPRARIRRLADISLCYNLRVCILSNNHLQRFDALVSCSQLVRLDLHSNQIINLPNASFWSYMDQLQILNLHDNPIGSIDNLHHLASCSNLVALTLYDTPLSLKANYRHHVVNSIWSLKALDRHIISDEEIIEDAHFSGRFTALHPSFRVDLCPRADTDEEEMRLVHEVLKTINQVMAHVSPVLIIQRYSRGFLLRKRYKLIRDMRIWAAVTIQRRYREWKGLPSPATDALPPASPVARPEALVKIPIETGQFDYDTYLKNRRPGSVQLSDTQSARQSQIPSSPVGNADQEVRGKNLVINLAKLHASNTHLSEQGENVPVNTVRSADNTSRHRPSKDRSQAPKGDKIKKRGRDGRRIRSVKQFFGPVVESTPSPSPEEADGEEVPLIDFRLRGRKKDVVYYDATTEMLMARREAGQDVRCAEDSFHRQQMVKSRPTSKPRRRPDDQPTFAGVQGTMGLTCLQAIQQAYRDREKAERRAFKKETVHSMKDERDAAKSRLRLYQEDKRNKVLHQREQEQRQLLDAVERQEKARLASIERYNEIRQLSSRYQKHCQEERSFIVDFSVQNTSVSNALLRHDWQARAEDQFNQKINLVQGQKEMEHEQQEVVKKYMEHRQLMRQTESALSRAAVDTKMLQEANGRLVMARNRVTQLKSRNENVSTFYPLPCVSSQPLPSIPPEGKIGSLSMKHFNKWNSDKLTRYHTVAPV